jgi:hypothetical protein
MIRTIRGALACSLAISTGVHAADTYPRLATYAISSPKDYYTDAYQQKLAKLQVAIIATYPGWGASQNVTLNDTVKKIKALNPNTRVFQYVLGESLHDPAEAAYAAFNAKVDQEKWWLYTSGVGTTKVLSDFGGGDYILNITPTARQDASGKTFAQWFGGWAASQWIAPNPDLDGIFTDNVFWSPRRDGDWDRNGTSDSHTNATVQASFRAGYGQYLTAFNAAAPGKMQLANAADWVQDNAVITEYSGKFQGAVIEHMQKLDTSAGWLAMMKGYRKVMAALAAPKLGICSQDGSVTDYQGMRYGFASCAMDDGYYAYADTSKGYYGVPWFDEFNAKLGTAVSGPQTSAWQTGVYRRDFANGIVLVNPKGNGPRTVTLEADFVKIKGTQDATVNNGATVRQVTLKDRDGLVLLRKAPIVRPNAPADIQVTQ